MRRDFYAMLNEVDVKNINAIHLTEEIGVPYVIHNVETGDISMAGFVYNINTLETDLYTSLFKNFLEDLIINGGK